MSKKLQEYQNDDLRFESVKIDSDDLDEKYGEIYKKGSSIIFRCEFCLQLFQQLFTFIEHVEQHIDNNDNEESASHIMSCNSEQSSNSSFTSEKESLSDHESPNKRKKINLEGCVKQKDWRLEKIFATEKDMDHYITKENTWGLKKKFYTKKGCKKYFRCNKVKSRGEACAMKLMTFKNIYTDEFILYKSKTTHTCDQILSKGSRSMKRLSPLSDEIKLEIEKHYKKEFKIKKIVEHIEKMFGSNKINQVKRYIKILQVNQDILLTDELITKWIEPSLNVPQDEKQPFVVHYEVINNLLRFFISCKFLLKNILNVTYVNFIGTKKITWQNYVIYIVGSTLNEKEFLCFGIAICKNDEIQDFEFVFRSLIKASKVHFSQDFSPTHLCRDSNENLEIAFKNIFPSSKVKICWDHVSKCIKKKLEDLLPNQLKKEEIVNELNLIKKSLSQPEFEVKVNKFLENWAIYVEFTTYFHNNWVIKNKNWYDGIDITFSSTNKPMDVILKEIEDDHTFRTKIPFDYFKQKIIDLINKFSYLFWSVNVQNNECANKMDSTDTVNLMSTTKNLPIQEEPDSNSSYKIKKIQKKKNTSYKTHTLSNKSLINTTSSTSKSRKVIDKMWREENTFGSFVEAENAIEKEKTWGFMTKSKSKSGIKRYYRCNRVPSRGQSCESGLYLFLKADSTEVVLMRSGLPHTCHEIPCKNRGLSEEIRDEIKRLTDMNWKTKQVFEYLQENNFSPMPSKVQVNNYIGVLRERKFNETSLKMTEMENWLKDNCHVPDCESKMFVVSHETNNDNFKFFISSKKLLQNIIEMKTLNIDSIRKIDWLKYQVHILATTNCQNKCKCLGIAVLSQESLENFEYIFKAIKDSAYKHLNEIINPHILVTDSNPHIQGAFRNVFGSNVKIKMCWDIVKKSVKKHLEELNFEKDIMCNIIRSLDLLHKSNSEIEFHENLNNFKNKWQKYEEFFNNFNDTWIKKNNSWYQGYCKGTCISNTRLDNFVKSIRNDQFYRKKICLKDFGTILAKYIECWSFESESRYVC